jgi:hypothetical protein
VFAKPTYADLLAMTGMSPDTVVLVFDASGDPEAPTKSALYAYVKIVEPDDTFTYGWKLLDIANVHHADIPANVRVATPLGTGTGACWAAPSNLKDLLDGYDPEVFNEIWLKGDLYDVSDIGTIPSNITIRGGFAGTESLATEREFNELGYPTIPSMLTSTVDGPVLQVGTTESPVDHVTIDGLMFSDHTIGVSTCLGACVEVYGSSHVTLSRCTFVDNQASEVGGCVGGSTFTVDTCVFHENLGGNGTAICGSSYVTVKNARCYSNYSYGQGGAIAITSHGILENCDVYNNTATTYGGGVYGSFDHIVACTLANNMVLTETGDRGGGLYLTNASAVVFNTAMVGNKVGDTLLDITFSDGTIDYCIATGTLPGTHCYKIDNMATLGCLHPTTFTGAPCVDGIWIGDMVSEVMIADFSPNGYAIGLNKGVAVLGGVTAPTTDIRGTARDTTPDIGAYQYTIAFATPVLSVNGFMANSLGEVTTAYRPLSRTTGSTIEIDPRYSVYLTTIDSNATITLNLDKVNMALFSSFDLGVTIGVDGLSVGFLETYTVNGDPDLSTSGLYFFTVTILDGAVVVTYLGRS